MKKREVMKMHILLGMLEYSLIGVFVLLAILLAVIFFKFVKKKPDSFVKFGGTNYDVVWCTPELSILGDATDVVVPFSHEAIVAIDGVVEKTYHSGRHTFEKKAKYKNQQMQFYFVNKTVVIPIKWGTPSPFDVIDPVFKMPIRVGAHGAAKINVSDSKSVVFKLVGSNTSLTINDVENYFRSKIHSDIVDALANVMISNQVSYFEIASKMKGISKLVENELKTSFTNFGFDLSDFVITAINIPQDVYQNFSADKELTRRLEEREMKFKELYENSRVDQKDEAKMEVEIIKALKDESTYINIEEYNRRSK